MDKNLTPAQAAKAVFDAHPKVNRVLVTKDGNVFLPEARGLAQDHARKHGLPEPEVVERGSQAAPAADNPKAAKGETGKPKKAGTKAAGSKPATGGQGGSNQPEAE